MKHFSLARIMMPLVVSSGLVTFPYLSRAQATPAGKPQTAAPAQATPAQRPQSAGSAQVASSAPSGATAASVASPATSATAAAGSPEPIPIGILAPHTAVTDPSAQAIGEQVRVLLARSLAGTEVDAVLLFSTMPEMVAAEAKQHHCAYVLDSTITQKKGSGLNKMMLLQGASMVMPMASIAGNMGGMIAGTAAGAAASSAGSMAGFMHSNTTWTFEYKLLAVGEPVPVLAQTETVKTKKEGEDVLTPMVQHAALAIATQTKKKD